MATPTPIRSGTKATPQAVFAACDRLRVEMGDFRNEDVLAITGGGLGTVSRLVKMYKQHEHIVAANDALDAEVTISLVQALDQLLKSQLQRSQQATDDFMRMTGVEISELSESLEREAMRTETLKSSNEAFQQQIAELENHKAKLETMLDEKKRELAEKDSALAMKNNELQHVHKEHASKLEQLNSQHQHQLATALEKQRQALSQEHAETLSKASSDFESQLKSMQDENRETQAVLNQRLDIATQTLHDTQNELGQERQARALLQQQLPQLECQLKDKHQELVELQKSHHAMIEKTQTMQEDRALSLTQELSATANTMSTTVHSVSDIIKQLQDFLEKSRKPSKKNKH